jgi:hypothetical protein
MLVVARKVLGHFGDLLEQLISDLVDGEVLILGHGVQGFKRGSKGLKA